MPQVVSAGLLMYRWTRSAVSHAGLAATGQSDQLALDKPPVPAEPSRDAARLEVLLGHPGGPYYAKKDAGIWSIPKGMAEPDELDATPRAWGGPPKPRLAAAGADLLAVARREFAEETGFVPEAVASGFADDGRPGFLPLGGVKYRNHKIVYAWAFAGDCDPAAMVSNTFQAEWPRGSGRAIEIPELDRVAWFDLPRAREAILPAQVRFIDDLEALVVSGGPPGSA